MHSPMSSLPPHTRTGAVLASALVLSLFGAGPVAGQVTPVPATPGATDTTRPPLARPVPVPVQPEFRLVESWPAETTLDNKDIPDAADVWVELINSATQSLDIAQFYASDDPEGGGRLKTVVDAIEAAARRGVPVRFLCEEKFYKLYPGIADRLAALPNTQVKRLDSAAFNGGVLHAKYFIVNGQKCFIGSQNFDWRSLDHIQELGAVVENWDFTQSLKELFELDWLIAGFVTPGKFAPGEAVPLVDSLVASRRKNGLVGSSALKTGTPGDMVWARLAVSPSGRLTNERLWDEPRLLDMIATAATTIDIQLLTYSDLLKDGEHWETLEKALKAAAKRGVTVRLLLSDWCKARPTIDSVRDIAKTKGVEVKFMVIPEASTGFVPFSRVAHAKYMVIDEKKFWLGSANWEHNYFHTSRNVGMIVEGAATSARLKSYFEGNWTSAYAEPLDMKKEYVARRVAE